MRVARRTFLAATVAAVAAPAVLRLARADAPQFTLKLHHAFSAVSCGHDRFLVPWARRIEAQSDRRIRIDIFPSMALGGQPAALFDQARDGLADIAWVAPSNTPGRFPKIETFELPFVPSRRALVSSKAIQDFAEANLKDEFREVRPLCFSCTDRGVLHAAQPIQTIGDIEGLKLQVRTRFAGEAVRALGARPVAMPSAQLPIAINRHVVDGCVDPWDMVPALKLHELLKAHTEFAESSLSMTTLVLAMNKTAYERLPADLRKVIDDNSGQHAAGMAGTMWDLQATAVANMVTQRGDSIITLQPEAVVRWRKATDPVIEAWQKQMKEQKVDGGKLIVGVRALLAKYADEPEPQPPQPSQPKDQQPPVETKPELRPSAAVEVPPDAPAPPVVKPAPAVPAAPAAPAAPVPAAPPTATIAQPAPSLTPMQPLHSPATPAAPMVPPQPPAPAVAPPAPVLKPPPAAVSPPKTLDIPL